MGIPLVGGGDFDERDRPGRAKVAVVSADLARRCFGSADPVGRTFDTAIGPSDEAEPKPMIVGVVGHVKNGSLAWPADPQLYVPYAQVPLRPSATFVTRHATPSATEKAAVIAAIRNRVRAIDAHVPIVQVRPLEDLVHTTLRDLAVAPQNTRGAEAGPLAYPRPRAHALGLAV